MERVEDSSEQLGWLSGHGGGHQVAGYDLEEWPASTWILHAMYENPALRGLGTHDELHRRRLDSGDIAPIIIGDVNLEEGTTVTGTPLGFVVRPGKDWERLSWREHMDWTPGRGLDSGYPPCHRWFPAGSWPVAIEAPPEGSLDEVSITALIDVLGAEHGAQECFALWAPLAAGGDFDATHLWRGPVTSVPELLDDFGGPYSATPSNLWPSDRSWFVYTDWDLQATRVSGSESLVAAVKAHADLETIDWSAPA